MQCVYCGYYFGINPYKIKSKKKCPSCNKEITKEQYKKIGVLKNE